MEKSIFEDEVLWQQYKEELFSWEGTPYRHLEAVKGRGADCTLYIVQALVNIGIFNQMEFDFYSDNWYLQSSGDLILDSFRKYSLKNLHKDYKLIEYSFCDIVEKEFERGDVLTFSFMPNKRSTHHASVWLAENRQMINSINRQGVKKMPFGNWWEKRRTFLFRIVRSI
jgi:cell wall-associated NlpC family hydrolase